MDQPDAPIPRRPFGKTGDTVSILGVGGHHLGDIPDLYTATRLVQEAIDAGISFFDCCWEYWNGRSEVWLGHGLKNRRDKVFLMTKVCTHGRSKDVAMRMLEESLKRLRTDHLDLWQAHAMSFDNDPELAYAKNGVLEAFELAKKQGKVRYVGFTGHKAPHIHLDMIRRGYPFDSVQMPLNPFDCHFESFEKLVLPELNKRGIAALGMKPMNGSAAAIKQGILSAKEMLGYAMSLPVAVTISGMDSIEILRENIALARGFKPLTNKELDVIRAKAAPASVDGKLEPYKLSLKFDNPVTRLSHGFPIDAQIKEVKKMLQEGNGTWTTEPVSDEAGR